MLKVITLLQNPLRHISGKSGDFRGSSPGEGDNVWTNQRLRQTSWISNCSPSGTFVARLVTENAVVLKKKLNRHMDLQTDDRTDRSLTPFTCFFCGVCVHQSLVICVVLCRLLFVLLSFFFGHFIGCSLIYSFCIFL